MYINLNGGLVTKYLKTTKNPLKMGIDIIDELTFIVSVELKI